MPKWQRNRNHNSLGIGIVSALELAFFCEACAISPDNLLGRRPEPEGGGRGAQLLQTSRVQENVVVVRLKESQSTWSLIRGRGLDGQQNCQGAFIQGDPSPGEPAFGMFHHLAQLLSRFCQIPTSPSRIGQRVEQSKYKSTQPRFARRWITLYMTSTIFWDFFTPPLSVRKTYVRKLGGFFYPSLFCANVIYGIAQMSR